MIQSHLNMAAAWVHVLEARGGQEGLLSSTDLLSARGCRHIEALLGQSQLATVGQGLVALIAGCL